MTDAILALADGTVFKGQAFGAPTETIGKRIVPPRFPKTCSPER